MRRISLIISGVAIFSLLAFSSLTPVLAAVLTLDGDISVSLPNGIALTILSGSTAESVTVSDDSTLTVITASDSNITITSANGYNFSSDVGTLGCSGNTSQFRITGSAGSHMVAVTTSAVCPITPTGGTGGGGGGGTPPVAPTNTSVMINSGAAQTENVNTTLTLAATNASLMMISNTSDFSDSPTWQTYATTKTWNLAEGVGTKTVYSKFRSSDGGESAAVSDTIELISASVGTVANSGKLIKLACGANATVNDSCKKVYYVGQDGKRYVFPNENTFKTWYSDFSSVQTVTADQLANYPMGSDNITYRPGVKLVKITTDPKVYAVDKSGVLRWIKTESLATSLYGINWAKVVEDVPDNFFANYETGPEINAVTDYSINTIKADSPDINTDKGL